MGLEYKKNSLFFFLTFCVILSTKTIPPGRWMERTEGGGVNKIRCGFLADFYDQFWKCQIFIYIFFIYSPAKLKGYLPSSILSKMTTGQNSVRPKFLGGDAEWLKL